jgi:solute carrier family 35, member C2
VATITVSAIVFGDKLTVVNILGLCVTLFGIALYNWMKFHERRSEQIELGQEDDAGYEEPRRTQMYSQVAESTPMLLVDNEYHEDESDMESDIELEANRHTTAH